jgi:threonine/homoserine/homoserine lactone efflux protein
MTEHLVAFAAVALLLTLTPGADTAFVIRSALVSGRLTAVAGGLGVCLGVLSWGAATALGLSALLAASELAYAVLRIAGACYLLWLGGRMLWRALRGTEVAAADAADGSAGPARAFGQGLLTNLLNPKVGVFYATLLPPFIPDGEPVLGTSLLLAGVHVSEGILWFALLIWLTDQLGRWLRRPRTLRAIDAVTGTVLVGFAARLVFGARPATG